MDTGVIDMVSADLDEDAFAGAFLGSGDHLSCSTIMSPRYRISIVKTVETNKSPQSHDDFLVIKVMTALVSPAQRRVLRRSSD
ncbi:hypothetical protein, partial [Ilumatobacter sp.]|uniref:hypothetical protein n=1 Tax=Ilumatobacter sp. TaxID=1967498 RepID=UPI003750744B